MPIDYKNSKIYKVVDNTTNEIYIGSTTRTLYQRKAEHEKHYRRYLAGKANYLTVFEVLKNKNSNIILIENYPCADRSKLHAREGYFHRNMECVNKRVEGRTQQEYKQDHKERLIARDRQYYKNNSTTILENKREYRKKNRDLINEKRRIRDSVKVSCACSGSYVNSKKYLHTRSKLHQDYMKLREPIILFS